MPHKRHGHQCLQVNNEFNCENNGDRRYNGQDSRYAKKEAKCTKSDLSAVIDRYEVVWGRIKCSHKLGIGKGVQR